MDELLFDTIYEICDKIKYTFSYDGEFYILRNEQGQFITCVNDLYKLYTIVSAIEHVLYWIDVN